jgi:signal transduction histidine kinase
VSINPLIRFGYGLILFTMGLVVAVEVSAGSRTRLRRSLYWLALFGILHGGHEWSEVFLHLGIMPGQAAFPEMYNLLRISMMGVSFLCLAFFGVTLINIGGHHAILAVTPLLMGVVWLAGAFGLRYTFPVPETYWPAAEAWLGYTMGFSAALLAAGGLIMQQREFRRTGEERFGQDALWAAMAFFWYGITDQLVPPASQLPTSDVFNEEVFYRLTGIPIQAVSAFTGIIAVFFIMRMVRQLDEERRRRISDEQASRLLEARRREAMVGEMLQRVVAAQESERRRIARELHDDTGQALTALGLGLRGAAKLCTVEPLKTAEHLTSLQEMVNLSMENLHRIILDLRPSHLDDLGLPSALRWYAGEMERRSPIKIQVEVRGEPYIVSPEVDTSLFRIAQEALGNVYRHSKARTARVRLEYLEKEIVLNMTDDGGGFDLAAAVRAERRPWGLIGMQERANLMGGKFSIDSKPDQGTEIEVVVPRRIEETRVEMVTEG